MANTNPAGVKYLSDNNSDGTIVNHSGESIGFFGTTPVAVQTLGSAAVAIDPTASGSALVASIHSIAISAASLANANRTVLSNLGLAD